MSTNQNQFVLDESKWQYCVSKRACTSYVPVWTNVPHATLNSVPPFEPWFLSFHCLPRPPFGWGQYFPTPFNCQQVPLLHVTVSDVVKAMGKQKGRISPKHNLCWEKFVHLENFVFILCVCLLAKNKWRISIDQLLINVWKQINRLFKHRTSKQTTSVNSVPVLHITHAMVCCQTNSTAPRIAQFFHILLVKSLSLVVLFVDWSIMQLSQFGKFTCRGWCVVLNTV